MPGRTADVSGALDQQILLAAGPIHYDILLPLTSETRSAFGFLAADELPVWHPDASWLAVGWGSEAFYTATGTYRDLQLQTIWTAATGDTSVLRFEVLGEVAIGGKVRAVSVSDAQLARLRGLILQDLRRDVSGAPTKPHDAQLSGNDVFYRAQTGFSIFRTCNVWVGAALRRAGVKMGGWTPTPYAVTLSLWRFH